MLAKLTLAWALAFGALAANSNSSLAGTDVDIGIGLGLGLGGDYHDGGGAISCREGARIVADAGFRRVRPLDCSGREYAYRGIRRHRMFEITIRSRSGRIVDVSRVGGGYGDGYGDGFDDGGY